MNFIYDKASEIQLASYHNQITIFMVCAWIVFSFWGYTLKSKNNINRISLFLLSFSFLQEILDYINRITNEHYYGGGLKLVRDLPLQLCHFAYWLSVLTLLIIVFKKYKKYQNTFFNLAYFFGFSGALMGIITVSYEGIYTFGDILFLDLQHSIIILNVLWLIFAYKLKFSFLGILQSFIFVNIAAICVGLINIFIGGDANYMFLCRAPEVDNPLLFGGVWPYYIIGFEFIFFIYGLLVLLPFKIGLLFNKKRV